MPDDTPPPPPKPFAVEFRVRYAETDQMGVVYHAEYLVWCEIGRTEFIRAHARSYAELEADGIKLAVVEAALRYHGGARYDDLVRVETRLVEVRSRMMRFEYVVSRADTNERLVSASTTLMSVDESGRGVSLPAPVRTALDACIG